MLTSEDSVPGTQEGECNVYTPRTGLLRLRLPHAARENVRIPMAETSGIAILQAARCCSAPATFAYSLPSVVSVVSQVVEVLMSRISSFRIQDGSEDDIELALQEALLNAVIHGNREDPFKRVRVALHCEPDGEIEITIGDEGAGFDFYSVPDPTDQEHLLSTHGRGIFLMRRLMDEVSFEERGTVVRLRKRSSAARRRRAW